jgi:enamine deaminase RidA (YjgF/YER057c/UK114 family)
MSPRARTARPGLRVAAVEEGGVRSLQITARPLPGEDPLGLLDRLEGELREAGAAPVKLDVFGTGGGRRAARERLEALFGEKDAGPVTWIEEGAEHGPPIAGLHAFAVAGAPVRTLRREGRPVGRAFELGATRWCALGDLGPADPAAPRAVQAEQTFEALQAALAEAGMGLEDVARTWFVLDDILAWYGPFNLVRTGFFRRSGLAGGRLPASTGVGGRSPSGGAIRGAAWAVRAAGGPGVLAEVPSPLQGPAPDYGSAFSRAVEVAGPGSRRLLVSGTASVGPDGGSLHPGDPEAQIDRAMAAVEGLLESRGMALRDVTRAVAYVQGAREAGLFGRWCRDRGLAPHPVVAVRADLCRPELLFEIELDAVVPRPAAAP